LAFALLFALPLNAQETNQADSTGLPGDNFSLEGALALFKKAESPENFEKLLNAEDNYVNNLDLNEDGEIDYIRVIDNSENDAHAIILQVPVSEKESQDIAVIEIEKRGKENAILQIIGDEDIYGESTIVEPFNEEGTGGKGGPSPDYSITRIVVNVWLWPSVRYVYAPGYRIWISPWRWHYYPVWWRPWRPHPWYWHHSRTVIYRPHYHVVTTHRVVTAHKVYTPRRRSSKVVHTRTTTKIAVRNKNGKVVAGAKTTTTKTGVKGRNGRKAGVKTTTTKAGVKGKNGKKAGVKTTTTKAGVKGRNGRAVGAKKTTTRSGTKGRKGGAARKKSTTKTVKKRKRG